MDNGSKKAYGGPPVSNALEGIAFMVLACVFFGVMHVGVRHVTQSIHPFEAAFFRNLFGLLVLAPSFITHGLRPLRTRRFGLHCVRAALNVVAMLCFSRKRQTGTRRVMIPSRRLAIRYEENEG